MKAGCVKSMDKTLIPMLYASQEYDGERHECPWCHGGKDHELSFTITKTDRGYLYNCYRDRCRANYPSSGFYATTMQATSAEPVKKKSRAKEFRHETRALAPVEYAWLQTRYGLKNETLDEAGVTYAPKTFRYVFPIRGPYGEPRGVVARRFHKVKDKKKAIAYPSTEDAPFAHWAVADSNHTVIIVEDFLSALRVYQQGYTALALLGTHLPEATLSDLIKYSPYEVVVALDPDATDKAFELRRKLKLYFPKVRVAILDKDVKDTKYEHEVKFALGIL